MDIEHIEGLIEIAKGARVTEVSVKNGDSAVVIRKSLTNGKKAKSSMSTARKSTSVSSASDAGSETRPVGTVIQAPMVGILHLPEGISKCGVKVQKGQVVGAIESMKLMNDVVSTADGKISEVYVEDGLPVEYGQALFLLNDE